MNVLVYRVTLLESTLVTALEGDPNSGISFSYLPGSALRGVVIAKYRHAEKIGDLARDPHARRLFFDGTTRYLNAYPLDRLDCRTAPVPFSLHRVKGQDDPIYDFASENPPGNQQWQALNTPFCTFPNDGKVRLVQPDRQINVHTARQPPFRPGGRPWPCVRRRPGGRVSLRSPGRGADL